MRTPYFTQHCLFWAKMAVRLRHVAALGAALMVGGCALAGLGGNSAPDIYDLPAADVQKGGRKLPVYIAVSTPNAMRSLDTDQILVRDPQGRLTYFPASSWGDRLPKLVQARLMQALTDSGRFKAVGKSDDRAPSDVTLNIDMRSFNIEVKNGHAEAVVDIVAKLVDERNGKIMATKQFSAIAPAVKDDAAAGVAALSQAFSQITTPLINWSANSSGSV